MALWLAAEPLILASRSAVRRAMLEAAGIPTEMHAADIDERGIEALLGAVAAGEAASLLAREKATAVAARFPRRIVVGADQILAIDGMRFSKPADRAAARDQLRRLSGRTHELHSAVAVAREGRIVFSDVAVARLAMRDLSDRFLDAYLDAGGPAVTESVGGYQLEKLGVHLFERIEGDHFTILGLPLMALLAFLRRDGSLAG
jgi:septum formation protein